jgi:hypothetical protein
MVDVVGSYARVFLTLSLIVALAGALGIWVFRHNYAMKARFPKIFFIDVFFHAIHAANVSLWYVSYFRPDVVGCQPANSFVEGIEWGVGSILLGRSCLFYIQTRANALTEQSKLSEIVVDALAFFTAPGQYYLLKKVVQHRLHPDQVTSMIPHVSTSRWNPMMIFQGSARFFLCFLFWTVIGFVTSWSYTFNDYGAAHTTPQVNAAECFVTSIRIQTGVIFFLVAVCALLIVSFTYHVEDLVGLRQELVATLGLISVVKIFNAFNLWFLFLSQSFWIDIASVLLSPLLSLIITGVYSYKLHRNSQRKDSICQIGSVAELEVAFLKSKAIRDHLIKSARQFYMSEVTDFLMASEKLTESTPFESYVQIYNLYVKAGSVFEINVSSDLRRQADESMKNGVADLNMMSKLRCEMFSLLFLNLKHVLAEINSMMNGLASSGETVEGGTKTSIDGAARGGP